MPRDCICLECGGAYDGDDMSSATVCMFCALGLDTGMPETKEEEE